LYILCLKIILPRVVEVVVVVVEVAVVVVEIVVVAVEVADAVPAQYSIDKNLQ